MFAANGDAADPRTHTGGTVCTFCDIRTPFTGPQDRSPEGLALVKRAMVAKNIVCAAMVAKNIVCAVDLCLAKLRKSQATSVLSAYGSSHNSGDRIRRTRLSAAQC